MSSSKRKWIRQVGFDYWEEIPLPAGVDLDKATNMARHIIADCPRFIDAIDCVQDNADGMADQDFWKAVEFYVRKGHPERWK